MRIDLSLRHLEVFNEVARAGSFTAAAQNLHVAQSTLSRSVQESERRLQVRLFSRSTREVRLTPEGRELAAIASTVLSAHRDGMTRLASYLDGHRGQITLGTLPSVAASMLPAVLPSFMADHPSVKLRIEDGLNGTVRDAVLRGGVDFAFGFTGSVDERLTQQPLLVDRFDAVVHPRHPLADRPQITWAELAKYPFAAIGTESSVRQLADRAFQQAGVSVARRIEATNVATVGGLVAAGAGVTAFPALVRDLVSFAGLAHRPLEQPTVERELGVIALAGRPQAPAGRLLLECLLALPYSGTPLSDGVRWIKQDGGR